MVTVHNLKTNDSILDTGRQALLTEISGLQSLANTLGPSFETAIHAIKNISGRVIVSGMGKSAHVGRKISATLASTGQPAYFVHPAEASHGDLGMITEDDILIVLSYSGETQELNGLITYAGRFNIPIIAITGKDNSTLAKVAQHLLLLPNAPEACPMGLAPTTSTTMMMALGDALATTLLSLKGFSSQDFKVYHPGGNLGHSLTRVGDRMHTGDRLPLMSAKGFGCVGIINQNGALVGVITDGDLRRHMGADLMNKSAVDVMTANPSTVSKETMLAQALALLNKKTITSLFVVETDTTAKPCGIIHIHDFLRMGIV
jgi:arabinose-5-phosphate isomerase